VRLFLHELRNQQRLFWRNRESAVFVFVFPPMLYLLLGAVYTGRSEGFKLADVLLVGLIGYGCANTAFAGLAITLVIRRESGVLKRIRATPLPMPTYLVGVLCSTLFVFVLQMLLTITLGLTLYGAKGPKNWPGMVPAVLVGVACFAGMGFGIASLIRSSEGASAVVNLIVLPMAFLSGSFGPTRHYPEVLQWIADVLPLTYLIDLMNDVYLRGGSFSGHPKEIGIMLAWGLAGVLVAWRRFGWEPRER
jgi:ABC-2 type transport system permease protein